MHVYEHYKTAQRGEKDIRDSILLQCINKRDNKVNSSTLTL